MGSPQGLSLTGAFYMILNIIIFISGILHPGLFTAIGLGITLANPSFGLSLLIGYWLGVFINSQMFLPLIYAFPKSIYLVWKRKIRFMAIPMSFVPYLIWQIILIAIYFISEIFFPRLNEYLGSSTGFNFGWFLSVLGLIYGTYFTASGRDNIRKDYEEVFVKKYLL